MVTEQEVKAVVETTLSSFKRSALTQFPKVFYDNPCFEFPREEGRYAQLLFDSYLRGQKEEYIATLKLAEEMLNKSTLEDWTSEYIEKLILELHGQVAKTLIMHPASSTVATKSKSKPGELRVDGLYSFKEPPIIEDLDYPAYNESHPWDIFSVLVIAYDYKTATNFVKWFLKWGQGLHPDMQLLLDQRMEICLKQQNINVKKWRAETLGGLTLDQWLKKFYKDTGNKVIENWKKQVESLDKIISEQIKCDELTHRATLPGLYTKEEEQARDIVMNHFTPVSDLASKFKAFAKTLSAQLRSKDCDPLQIAAEAHVALNHRLHPFINGNGRVSRIFCNMILMQFGYFPLFQEKTIQVPQKKQAYYRAIESGDPALFAKFLLARLHETNSNNVCLSARKNDVKSLAELLCQGASPSVPASAKELWTPLHYACAMQSFDAAYLLVSQGASLQSLNNKNKTPIEGLKDQQQRKILLELAEAVKQDSLVEQGLKSLPDPYLSQFRQQAKGAAAHSLLALVMDYARETTVPKFRDR